MNIVICVFLLVTLRSAIASRCTCAPKEPPCTGTNKEVYRGNCLCIPGYKLEFGECTLDCTNGYNGQTFNKYEEQEVSCNAFGRDTDLDRCLNSCRSINACRSVVHYEQSRECYHSPCDPLTTFGSFVRTGYNVGVKGATLYVKNCAEES